jgi:hypothetical protein
MYNLKIKFQRLYLNVIILNPDFDKIFLNIYRQVQGAQLPLKMLIQKYWGQVIVLL